MIATACGLHRLPVRRLYLQPVSVRLTSGNVNAGAHDSTPGDTSTAGGFLPEQPKRRAFESVVARLVATAGIVGIGTALGAILSATDVAGWIAGLVVSIVTVVFAAMLWRSRQL